ncbi:MAG: thioredoxin-disulfide reductase [Kiritimatiellae bacterium]|nr:thioredoxin-disulfide reductase [Kiritimatiellia bacterium]
MNVLILGTGPAGLTAAIYCARASLAPVIIEGTQPGGQLTTTTYVENFPGFPEGVSGLELINAMRAQAERFGAEFRQGDVESTDLKSGALAVKLADGTVLHPKTLIIATGATARYLDLESVRRLTGHGVSGCATCDGFFYRGMPVAVVGGGDSAMEEALFLTRFASKVYIIHRRDALRASKIMADRVLAHEKIEVVWNSVVEEVLADGKDVVTGIRLRDVQTEALRDLPVDGVFMGIGHTPNTGPFKGQLDLDEKGYIITQFTRTSVAGVYAAGDVQDSIYRQAVTAVGSGCMAALEAERWLQVQ